MDKVSIIIPVHNRASLLPRTLRSIEAQTYRPIEVILVDNNSTDNSLAVCQDYSKERNRVDFEVKVIQELRSGANAARNAGLQIATGSIVSFYDSDDEMKPSRIAKAVEYIVHERLDVLFLRITLVDEHGGHHLKVALDSAAVEDQVLTSMISTQAFIARADFIRKIGGWNEALLRWQDWEIGVRILLERPSCRWIMEESFDEVHMHADSITGTGFSHSALAIHQAVKAVHKLLKENGMSKGSPCRALYFRESQLVALCKCEGDLEMARLFEEDLKRDYSTKPVFRLFVKLLQYYTAKGGRGAWRFVRALL